MDRREVHRNESTKTDTPAQNILLPSRQEALGLLRTAVEQGTGPVLLTGEAGSGKTWLVRQWVRQTSTPGMRWVSVDVPPGAGSIDLLRTITSTLGWVVEETATASSLRIALTGLLSEQAEDERSWGLVVDEAHLATPEIFEEVRLLSNRLRQAGGFCAIVMVGQTELTRLLSTWPMRALDARLSGRVHLGPIDADEARLLLGPAVSVNDAERRHRDAAGNPGRLLRLDPPTRLPAPWSTARRARLVAQDSRTQDEPKPAVFETPSSSLSTTPILPSRPPLSVEDGVIEVGWDAESDEVTDSDEVLEPAHSRNDTSTAPDDTKPLTHRPQTSAPLGIEVPVDDHYAALQAWNEWSANQGRSGTETSPTSEPETADPAAESDDDLYPQPPRARNHEEEEFTPYKQLFSRLNEESQEE